MIQIPTQWRLCKKHPLCRCDKHCPIRTTNILNIDPNCDLGEEITYYFQILQTLLHLQTMAHWESQSKQSIQIAMSVEKFTELQGVKGNLSPSHIAISSAWYDPLDTCHART